jgi:hypothetical protein
VGAAVFTDESDASEGAYAAKNEAQKKAPGQRRFSGISRDA